VTFVGSDIKAGSLADGRYTLVIRAAQVHGGSVALAGDGQTPGTDHQDSFFRLFGDSDGSGVVDYLDYYRFRGAYGKHAGDAGYLWYFDYDGDGFVGSADYSAFLANFGKSV
jgi:hypothetical protein